MKFEYKQIRVVSGIQIGKKDDDVISPKDLPDILNHLGAEGWDLIHFDNGGINGIQYYIFKRVIS